MARFLQKPRILSLIILMGIVGCVSDWNVMDSQYDSSATADATVALPILNSLFGSNKNANLTDYIDGAQLWVELTDNSCGIDPNSLKQGAKSYTANLYFPVKLKAGCSYKITLYLGKLDPSDSLKLKTIYSMNTQPGFVTKEQIATHLATAASTAMSLNIVLALTQDAIDAGIQFANGSTTAVTPVAPVQPIASLNPPIIGAPIPVAPPTTTPIPTTPTVPTGPTSAPKQEIDLKVVNGGYSPSSFHVKAGVPVRLTVTRLEKGGCGEEIIFPAFNKSLKLELNVPAHLEFTPETAGEFKFTCGMNMYEGKVIVQQ